MKADFPTEHQLPQLRQLWKLAFGDSEDFLDCFYESAYAPDRCRCISEGSMIAAALYWFDCSMENQSFAYIYAVATHPAYRNRGLCRQLMEDTHRLLSFQGYSGAVLVPQSESLRAMYAAMGYRDMGGLMELHCAAGNTGTPLRAIGPEEYALLRRKFLPPGGLLQEGENLDFLARQVQFFAGPHLLMAAWSEKDTLHATELLGDPEAAPGILRTLGFSQGQFRMPGTTLPFAMFCPFRAGTPEPEYFGFAFD